MTQLANPLGLAGSAPAADHDINAARADEWYRCRKNFLDWLRNHVKVMDKTAGGRVPFDP